jgi:hypothetical protein
MKGYVPTARKQACIAPAYGGAKMVLFGGSFTSIKTNILSDIYVLDVASITWAKGLSPDMESASNDHFIV